MDRKKDRPAYSFFTNRECEYFPCHRIAEEDFNCLFCYCPLYALGQDCGGNFRYLPNGVKDCSDCTIPHSQGGYEYVTERFNLISELASEE